MWKEANNVNLRSKNTWQAKALVQLFTYLQVRYNEFRQNRSLSNATFNRTTGNIDLSASGI